MRVPLRCERREQQKNRRITAQSRFSTSRVAETLPVRPARAADLDRINAIQHACFVQNLSPRLPPGTTEWWDPSPEKLALVPAFVADGGPVR
eukprot:SAG31_NODE_35222_length_325_cov_0.690265_1_plen_91_part_10